MDVNIRQLRSFIVVSQLKSFTRAADTLNLTQPTLTVQIRRLEEALDVKLLDRNTRKVSLTRLGKALLPAFQRMLQDLDTVISDTRDLAAMRRGMVRIAALPSFAASILPGIISSFRIAHSGASFSIRDAVASQILAMVCNEEVDIAIMGGRHRHPDVETLFEKQERLMAVFPVSHELASFRAISLDDLSAYPIVMLHPSTSVRKIVEDAFAHTALPIKVSCEATYMMTAVGMVSAGLGVTILPEAAREIEAFPDIACSPIDSAELSRKISIIVRKGRTLPPMSQHFCAHLMDVL